MQTAFLALSMKHTLQQQTRPSHPILHWPAHVHISSITLSFACHFIPALPILPLPPHQSPRQNLHHLHTTQFPKPVHLQIIEQFLSSVQQLLCHSGAGAPTFRRRDRRRRRCRIACRHLHLCMRYKFQDRGHAPLHIVHSRSIGV